MYNRSNSYTKTTKTTKTTNSTIPTSQPIQQAFPLNQQALATTMHAASTCNNPAGTIPSAHCSSLSQNTIPAGSHHTARTQVMPSKELKEPALSSERPVTLAKVQQQQASVISDGRPVHFRNQISQNEQNASNVSKRLQQNPYFNLYRKSVSLDNINGFFRLEQVGFYMNSIKNGFS